MTAYGARNPSDIAIEQARARGLTLDDTAERLNADPRRVRKVWAAMDANAAAADTVRPSACHSKAEHGTYAGYQAHRNHGENACQPCRTAATRYKRQQEARAAS